MHLQKSTIPYPLSSGRNKSKQHFELYLAEVPTAMRSALTQDSAQLRQMSIVNYDFTVHALMLVYTEEAVEERIEQKEPRKVLESRLFLAITVLSTDSH